MFIDLTRNDDSPKISVMTDNDQDHDQDQGQFGYLSLFETRL